MISKMPFQGGEGLPQERLSNGARLNGKCRPAPRYLEDFEPGLVVDLGLWHITAEEITEFANQWDAQPMHLDAHAAADTLLGGLAASGWHSSCILSRMVCDAFLTRSAVQGGAGLPRMSWRRPVLAGDLLRGQTEVISVRLSRSRPEMGLVQFRNHLLNQRDEVAVEFESTVLFLRRRASA